MAKVYPFRGLRYALSKIPVEKVLTQPYDKISKEMQQRYHDLHPNNIIRIVLGQATAQDGPDSNVYTRAASTLSEWRKSGALEQIQAPAFFVYFQHFKVPGTNEERTRKGFVGIAQLEDYKNKVIYPHERTLTGPKKDRLELLRHTRTHFEQIFMLYEDPAVKIDRILDQVSAGAPDIQVSDEYGVIHTVWTVTDPDVVSTIQHEMADKKLVIADGHHRYETALSYRDEMRLKAGAVKPEAPYERMPMTFFNMEAPGLTILPTHRVIANVSGFDANNFFQRASAFFEVDPASADVEKLRADLNAAGRKRITIGVCTDGASSVALLGLKDGLDLASAMPGLSESQRRLDVVILHRLLIERCLGISEEAVRKESNITYVREMNAALNSVKNGNAQISFLLNPTGLHQMRDVAYEGNVMPQKSTDFYPKVLSGLMMYSLSD